MKQFTAHPPVGAVIDDPRQIAPGGAYKDYLGDMWTAHIEDGVVGDDGQCARELMLTDGVGTEMTAEELVEGDFRLTVVKVPAREVTDSAEVTAGVLYLDGHRIAWWATQFGDVVELVDADGRRAPASEVLEVSGPFQVLFDPAGGAL